MNKKSQNLTCKYSIQQALYWAMYCGVMSYGIAFLLGKGFKASEAGTMLFFANLLSFAVQPFVASKADRISKNFLPKFTAIYSIAANICLSIIVLFDIPKLLLGILFFIGCACVDMQQPILYSMVIFYSDNKCNINYGLGRGIGAIFYGIVSLIDGVIVERFNLNWLIISTIILVVIFIVNNLTFPVIKEPVNQQTNKTCTLAEFVVKYKWYVFSLFGLLFLAMTHLMLENYLIEIFTNIGGGASNIGVALFIATVVETIVLIFLTNIVKTHGTKKLLILGGLSYILKVVLFICAKSIWVIYLAQVLQLSSYAFVNPTQIYYAKQCTKPEDMVKGQSMSTSFFAIGCAFGNLLGGVLISAFSLKFMLCCSLVIALIGTLIFIVTIPKAIKAMEI